MQLITAVSLVHTSTNTITNTSTQYTADNTTDYTITFVNNGTGNCTYTTTIYLYLSISGYLYYDGEGVEGDLDAPQR